MLRRIQTTVGYGLGYARLNLAPRPHREPPLPRTERDPNSAVLLIPGFLGTNHVMVKYQTLFHRDGIRAYTVNTGLYSAMSFGVAAELVVRRIRRIREERPGLMRLALVGHSQGGLLGYDLLSHDVRHGLECCLAAVGTPFRGTWAALLGAWCSPSAFQLLPVHPRYRADPSLRRMKDPFRIFAGAEDLLAPPERCRHPDARTIVFPTGHTGLLFEKRVYAAVRDFIAPHLTPLR